MTEEIKPTGDIQPQIDPITIGIIIDGLISLIFAIINNQAKTEEEARQYFYSRVDAKRIRPDLPIDSDD